MRKILTLVLGVMMGVLALAHAPMLSVDDLGDGTIFLTGGYTNDESAEGVEIIVVKDKAYNGPEDTYRNKMIIYKGVLDKDSTLTLPKPKTAKYEIYFNGGEGHVVVKKGPELKAEEEEKWQAALEKIDLKEWKEFMLEN